MYQGVGPDQTGSCDREEVSRLKSRRGAEFSEVIPLGKDARTFRNARPIHVYDGYYPIDYERRTFRKVFCASNGSEASIDSG
jgi:hypothetical protein